MYIIRANDLTEVDGALSLLNLDAHPKQIEAGFCILISLLDDYVVCLPYLRMLVILSLTVIPLGKMLNFYLIHE